MEDELQRLRYNINDLMEQLRQKNVSNISDVAYAILETGGQLSVILKSPNRPLQPRDMDIFPPPELIPITLIIDGQVIQENLEQLGLGLDWLRMELEKDGIRDFKTVLFACLDSQGEFFYQVKSTIFRKVYN
jgi:uncharacterized membrane protein YcaP (DUF421 family)